MSAHGCSEFSKIVPTVIIQSWTVVVDPAGLEDIERLEHKRALIAELEAQPSDGDPGRNDADAARQYRQAIQRRFTELVAEHRAKTDELAQLADDSADAGSPDPGLLAALPQLPLRLSGLSEHLKRGLYDGFQLQVRYHRPRHEVTIRVTIRADSLNHINGTVNAIKPQGEREKKRKPVHNRERALTSGYLLVEARSPLPGAPRVRSRLP
jgi:hypothetical protein